MLFESSCIVVFCHVPRKKRKNNTLKLKMIWNWTIKPTQNRAKWLLSLFAVFTFSSIGVKIFYRRFFFIIIFSHKFLIFMTKCWIGLYQILAVLWAVKSEVIQYMYIYWIFFPTNIELKWLSEYSYLRHPLPIGSMWKFKLNFSLCHFTLVQLLSEFEMKVKFSREICTVYPSPSITEPFFLH